jgi:hypothetical protein
MVDKTIAARNDTLDTTDETMSVASQLAHDYANMARFLRDQMELPVEEAFRRAADPGCATEERERLLTGPPDQVNWIGLQQLYAHDPEAGQAVWEHVKRAAHQHRTSGHQAAEPLDFRKRPWERAQFLALRAAFIDEWRPCGGIELALIDTLAQTYSCYLFWLGELHVRSSLEVDRHDPKRRDRWEWDPPRMEAGAAIDQAAAMVERFNLLFLRTLRALRDLRRNEPVIVRQAGQVNVGARQVNVAQSSENDEVA